MNLKVKIPLFIVILVLLSLSVTVIHLSFNKYKPELVEEIEGRTVSIVRTYDSTITEYFSGKKDPKQSPLNNLDALFKNNPQLEYLRVWNLKKKGEYIIYYRYLIRARTSLRKAQWLRTSSMVETKTGVGSPPEYKNKRTLISYRSYLRHDRHAELQKVKRNVKELLDSIDTQAAKLQQAQTKKAKQKVYSVLNAQTPQWTATVTTARRFVAEHMIEAFDEINFRYKKLNQTKRLSRYMNDCSINLGRAMNALKKSPPEGAPVQPWLSRVRKYVRDAYNQLKTTDIETLAMEQLRLDLKPKMETDGFFAQMGIRLRKLGTFIGILMDRKPERFGTINLRQKLVPISQALGSSKTIALYEIGISDDWIERRVMKIIRESISSSSIILLISLGAGLLLALSIALPIGILEKGVDEITKDIKYRISMKRRDEFGKFASTFNHLADQLTEELTKYEQLYRVATEDELTKLMVRRFFMETLDRELANGKNKNRPASIFMTDIDHFKQFNDTYGHQTGDIVLAEVAATMMNSIRHNRVRQDIVGRYGGEEFCVLLPDTEKESALILAERVRAAVETLTVTSDKGDALKVTISIGVATSIDSHSTSKEIIEAADNALYQSKENGRNQVTYAEE